MMNIYSVRIFPEYRYTWIKIPTMSAVIIEIPVDMIINTDASTDILDETVYHKVGNITQETELVTDVSPSGLSTNLI